MIDELLADAEAVALTEQIHPGGSMDECMARAAWTVIAEPGDAVAGALIAELGAAEALAVAVGHSSSLLSPGSANAAASRMLADGRARWTPRAAPRAVLAALHGAAAAGVRLLIPGDAAWPAALDDLGPHVPAALWVRGRVELLDHQPRVSIVGARASSGYGEHVASEIAGDLAATGVVIVSGGAYGIDGAAHRAALGVEGATVAFLAGGVDRAYPAGHQALLRRIAEEGALVSEPPCGTAPTKWRFLARNRLIAALGHATVVVEAGWRSGSLNTAGHAATLGRPLGAVPGAVTSASSAGCHRLLREYDAQCVTSAQEVRELFGAIGHRPDTSPGERDPHHARILEVMTVRARLSVDEVARRSGLSPDRVRSVLGLLHLEGDVALDSAGWHRAAPPRR
ncbi:Putative DNA processing protein DprA [Microbacterium oxydans]|uniref:DNA processing protein DprA n=1 Tax=Microbacterium oxydans TaxID=82380 RepID=A0A3Q9J808_9MICO|nr:MULTISPECIES: DNA-processing protein DprA [Microbacterium]AZS40665.1 Putative DNA processing protein DprA [Microbacterium oxydans]